MIVFSLPEVGKIAGIDTYREVKQFLGDRGNRLEYKEFKHDIDLQVINKIIAYKEDYLVVGIHQIALISGKHKKEVHACDVYAFSATEKQVTITGVQDYNGELLIVATSNGLFEIMLKVSADSQKIDLNNLKRVSWGECTTLGFSPSRRLFATHNVRQTLDIY